MFRQPRAVSQPSSVVTTASPASQGTSERLPSGAGSCGPWATPITTARMADSAAMPSRSPCHAAISRHHSRTAARPGSGRRMAWASAGGTSSARDRAARRTAPGHGSGSRPPTASAKAVMAVSTSDCGAYVPRGASSPFRTPFSGLRPDPWGPPAPNARASGQPVSRAAWASRTLARRSATADSPEASASAAASPAAGASGTFRASSSGSGSRRRDSSGSASSHGGRFRAARSSASSSSVISHGGLAAATAEAPSTRLCCAGKVPFAGAIAPALVTSLSLVARLSLAEEGGAGSGAAAAETGGASGAAEGSGATGPPS